MPNPTESAALKANLALSLLEMSSLPEPVIDAVSELIFSGHALAMYLGLPHEDGFTACICGATSNRPEASENHAVTCPVARFYAAVLAVGKAVK